MTYDIFILLRSVTWDIDTRCIADASIRDACASLLMSVAASGSFHNSCSVYYIADDVTTNPALAAVASAQLVRELSPHQWMLTSAASDVIKPVFGLEKPFKVFTRRENLALEERSHLHTRASGNIHYYHRD